jgi:hypothetical protein
MGGVPVGPLLLPPLGPAPVVKLQAPLVWAWAPGLKVTLKV